MKMITVGMNYQTRENKETAFVKKFALVLEVMHEMAGHVKTELYQNVFENRSYLVVSEWDTRDAFDSFVQSDEFRKVADWGAANILASRPKHEVYGE
jgi:chlorite dismutase